MHNFEASYKRIYHTLKEFSESQLINYQRRRPKLTDLEVVGLVLTAEYLGIDSENDLFRKLPARISLLIERSV